MGNLQKELSNLLNSYSAENDSDTPDFILADYLLGCLDVFNKTIQARKDWYREDMPTIIPPELDPLTAIQDKKMKMEE